MSDRPSNVVDERSLPWIEEERGARFAARRKQLGRAAGGRLLGCSLYEVPPGRRAWPMHWHAANEEALYILDGEGTLRIGGRDAPVRAGDYVALPPGPSHAHQLRNTGAAPLRYLAVSTMIDPDVMVYPDSNKIGVAVGAPPGGDKSKRVLSTWFPADTAVDYWTGELRDDED